MLRKAIIFNMRVPFPPSPPERLHKIDTATKNLDFVGVFRIIRDPKPRAGLIDENHLSPACEEK